MTLNKRKLKLSPRIRGENRSDSEPRVARICVAPSIEHCLTAVPYSNYKFNVYRTLRKVRAKPAMEIIDAGVTKEHWITKRVNWIQVGMIDLSEFNAPYECASACEDLDLVRETLKKWQKKKLVKKHMYFRGEFAAK